jgi:hypothetical protein
MITVIKNGINPILNQYDYPEINVKAAMLLLPSATVEINPN